MLRSLCKSKIHGATITQTRLYYAGSVKIDAALLQAADILPYERVQIVNLNNGARLETYVVPARAKSGTICLMDPAARLGQVGDTVHILSYALVDEHQCLQWKMKTVKLDAKNRPLRR